MCVLEVWVETVALHEYQRSIGTETRHRTKLVQLKEEGYVLHALGNRVFLAPIGEIRASRALAYLLAVLVCTDVRTCLLQVGSRSMIAAQENTSSTQSML